MFVRKEDEVLQDVSEVYARSSGAEQAPCRWIQEPQKDHQKM
jgi:hypothetical protein